MSNRWKQIEALFEEAVEQPPGERAAWLAERCRDEALRAEVEALLSAHERSGGILDRPLPGQDRPSEEAEDLTERRIGPYRLLREVGRGGMGTVYLAERDDGAFSRHVALKVLRPGLDLDERLARFRSERQILASFQHPNIATLHDGGVAAGGRPYFVMEYVEGRPLDRYCDGERCTIAERLRLFITVGHAVQHAHQNLVVHRDLKPSNMLVGPEGRVKLLDFGIARLLDEKTTPHLTRTGRSPMTPAYASPEQVRGDPITTASDVYQLGLVLYELLVGRRPYEVTGRSPREMEQVICETEPVLPSTAALQGATEAAASADPRSPQVRATARRASPERLRQALRGDLDRIVQKALRKEPGRRYASAGHLVEDLQRHLEGKPITARPDTAGYRLRKFARRHRGGVAAAALVLLALLAGVVGTTWQARRATQQARRAEAERDKAEQVTNFIVDVFEVSNPSHTKGDTVTARELLDRGAARLRNELEGQPEVQAALLNAIGRVYRQLGLYENAESLLEEALRKRRVQHEGRHPDVAESLYELGVLRFQQNEPAEGQALLEEALAMHRASFEVPHAATAATLTQLGEGVRKRGDPERSERLHREALTMRRALYGEAHRLVADSRFFLAAALHDQGRYAEAQTFFEGALAVYRTLPEQVTARYGNTLTNLAVFHEAKRNYAAAESLLWEALDVRKRLYGPHHPAVADSYGFLAQAFRHQGKLDSAEILYRNTLKRERAAYKGDHAELAVTLSSLGSVLREKGAYEEAERLLRESVAMNRRIYGKPHRSVALSLQSLADLLRDRGMAREAERHYRSALTIFRQVYGDEHPLTATVQVQLGTLLCTGANPEAGHATLRRALASHQKTLRAGHPRTAHAQVELGRCLIARRRYEQAERHLHTGYAAFDTTDTEGHNTRRALEILVRLYEHWGKPDEATTYRARLAEAERY